MGNEKANGPYAQPELEKGYLENKKPELKKDSYLKKVYLKRINENASQLQKEQIGKGKNNLSKVFQQPYGVNEFTNSQIKQNKFDGKKVDVKKLFEDVDVQKDSLGGKSMKPEEYDKRKDQEKPGGQFHDIQIDGKPIDEETYKKITAKQFKELSREQAFQLMQGGKDRISADSVESGDTVKIQFPTKDSYLHVTAASFPENIRSLKIGDKEYFRKGKNGEFFDKEGHRLVIGDKDPKKSQEIKIGEVLRGDKFDKMLKEYDTKTAEALKKMNLKEGTDKYEIMKRSLERGLSKDEVELWLNKDAAGIKKLSKDKQIMLIKNFMYLGQEGLTGKKDKALQINDAYAKKSVDKNGKTIYTFSKVDGKKTTEEMIKGADSFTVKRTDKEGSKKEQTYEIGKNEKGKFIYNSGKEKGKFYIAKEGDVIIPKEKEKDDAKKANAPKEK